MKKRTIKQVVELALPAYLMVYMAHYVSQRGMEFRDDIRSALTTGFAKFVSTSDAIQDAVVIEKIGSVSSGIISIVPNSTPQAAMLSVCLFTLKLVDRGLYANPKESCVLTALTLKEEWDTDEGEWQASYSECNAAAERMITHCILSNLYLTTGQSQLV